MGVFSERGISWRCIVYETVSFSCVKCQELHWTGGIGGRGLRGRVGAGGREKVTDRPSDMAKKWEKERKRQRDREREGEGERERERENERETEREAVKRLGWQCSPLSLRQWERCA